MYIQSVFFTGGKTVEKKIKQLSEKSLQCLLFQDSDEAPISQEYMRGSCDGNNNQVLNLTDSYMESLTMYVCVLSCFSCIQLFVTL